MRDIKRIKYLLNKYMGTTFNQGESDELFEGLKEIKSPDELNEIYQRGWQDQSEVRNISKLTWDEFIQRQQSESNKRTGSRKKIYPLIQWSIAASILLLIGIVYWTNSTPNHEIFETGRDEFKEIVLEDGTKVILKGNSKLIWDQDWRKKRSRSVEVIGEANFDVSHVNPKGEIVTYSDHSPQLIPFQVVTSDVNINVLGTAFDVIHRDNKTEVFLERGKVQLDLLESAERDSTSYNQESSTNRKSRESLIMVPGDFISFSSLDQDLKKIHTNNPAYQVDREEGVIFFDNIKLADMLKELEEIYDKNIVIRDSSLVDLTVSFGFPYGNWQTVVSLMELTLNVDTVNEGDVMVMKKMKR